MKKIISRLNKLLPNSRFARSVSVLAGGTASGQIIVIAASPILTRLYTPEDFGLLAVYSGILGMLGVIASLRYQLAIPLPDSDEEAANVVALCLLIVSFITAFIAIIVWGYGAELSTLLNAPSLENYLWLVPLGFFLSGLYQVFQYWAIRTKSFSIIAKTKILQSVSVASLQIVGSQLGSIALLGGRTLGQAVVSISLWKGIKSSFLNHRKSINIKAVIVMASRFKQFPILSSWAGLLNAGGSQVPPLFFSALFGPAAAGGYMLAQRIVNMPLLIVGTAIADAFLPSSIEALREKKLGQQVASLFSSLASFVFPSIIVLFFAAPDFFAFVFGPAWYQAGEIVRWLSPMLAVQFLVNPLSRVFITIERQGLALSLQAFLFFLRVTALLFSYFSNFSLLDTVKVFSFSSALGYAVYFLVISHVVKLDKILFARKIMPTIFFSLLMGSVCIGLSWLFEDRKLLLLMTLFFGGSGVVSYFYYFVKRVHPKGVIV